MTGKAQVCKLGSHIPIEGADKIVQVDMFGETIITSKDNKEGDLGLLFDCETQLSHEFASGNNLYRHSKFNKDEKVSGYLEDNRRIRPIKLKGVKVSGLWMPIDCLSFKSTDTGKYPMSELMEIDSFDGVKICEKYISPKTKKERSKNKEGRSKKDLVPTFKEHVDTDQWSKNKHKVEDGDLVILSEKLHGTSGRAGYLPEHKPLNKFQKFIAGIFKYIFKFNLKSEHLVNYKFVVGSRKVIKSISGKEAENKDHYYKEDLWTEISKECFEGKLKKGESVYFEIVGYTPNAESIMPEVSNTKLKKFLDKKEYKDFIKKYGETTRFHYDTHRMDNTNLYKVFVYRITSTNEDGDSIDYSWEQVKQRCKELDVSHVPELWKGFQRRINTGDFTGSNIERHINKLVNGESTISKNHIREGVAVRIENGNRTPIFLKHKSFIFKVLEGIVKDSDVIDIEESN